MASKADGNTIRTQRTRERVLATALRLFNELGEAHVTTGAIAVELDMSPGNLYYHFRNKDQIVEQLFARFEERAGMQPALRDPPVGPDAVEDLWLYLHLMLEAIWDYRFVYRNLDDLTARNPRLRSRFNRLVDAKLGAVTSLSEALVLARVMRATPAEIRALAENVLVVATYWLNYRALRSPRPHPSPQGDALDLGQGAYQVMALIAPYLRGEARRHLDRLGRNYIE